MTRLIGECASAVASAGVTVEAVSPTMGPASIESHYDEALAVPGILAEIARGEAEGVDGYVIACFGDPGLEAARELAARAGRRDRRGRYASGHLPRAVVQRRDDARPDPRTGLGPRVDVRRRQGLSRRPRVRDPGPGARDIAGCAGDGSRRPAGRRWRSTSPT